MFMPEGVGHRLHHSGDWSYHNPGDWDMLRAENIAIGIRLGQRWCSVSMIEDGEIKDLISKIPSLVTFTKHKTYYGTEAIRYSITNISNSIYQFFGLLGKKYDDKSVQQLIKHVTYNIIKIDRNKHPKIPKYPLIDEDIGIPIKFTSNGKPSIFTIIEIVSEFLQHIMDQAEEKVGSKIAHVAISVPNTFGQSQRLALMQAAKVVNIEPLRLVTSCMAASVCLRFYQMKRRKEEQKMIEEEQRNMMNVNNHGNGNGNGMIDEYDIDDGYDDDYKDDIDINNSPYSPQNDIDNNNSSLYAHGTFRNGYHKNDINSNGYSNSNGYGHMNGNNNNNTHNSKLMWVKKGSKKKEKKDKTYLVADLANIACSVSIIECKEKKHSDIVRVHHVSGNINDGIWRMINAFSLYVVKSFVDGYKGYYRPNLDIDAKIQELEKQINGTSSLSNKNNSNEEQEQKYNGHSKSNGNTTNSNSSKSRKKKKKKNGLNNGKINFYESITKYNYQNDVVVYDQLQQIESIERVEDDEDDLDDDDIEEMSEENNEALKCRFRSQMLCDTIIEHLHDQYKNEEVQIHYEKFYRSFSLQLILTTKKLHEIALNPFLFNMTNCIDKILQEFNENNISNFQSKSISSSSSPSRNSKRKKKKKGKKKKKRIKIDECILVGDGGNIPEVVSLFSEYFNINQELSLQPIVARGCAIVAAVDQELIPSPISLDLLQFSIRIEDAINNNDENTLIIESQTACPCKKTITRYTYLNNQTTYSMKFYEGESNNNKLCQLIGKFEIRNIEKRPKRDTKMVIAIHIDRNCIMFVTAEDVTSKPPKQLNVVKLDH